MATSSSNKSSLSPHHLPHFTPIEEGNEDEQCSQGRISFMETTPSDYADMKEVDYRHYPTPFSENASGNRGKGSTKKRPESGHEVAGGDRGAVSWNKCRPITREKISVVPLDNRANNIRLSMPSPNGIFKSIFSSFVKNSPRSTDESSTMSRDEQWKVAVAELSHKLIQATRRRDEADLEVSRSKSALAELEKKLNKLEVYCQSLKSNLDLCSSHVNFKCIRVGDDEKVIEHFLVSVSEARSSIRLLSRSLTLQLRQIGGNKVFDRIALLLRPYDIKISSSANPKCLLFYLEALLNMAFFEDFESIGFFKSSPYQILNPIDRCEANFAWFTRLQGLTWEDVLSRGTRQFSEDFSKFCDRKMSEIVAMLGWNRAWPEQVLQAFFGASKAVWLVHLLANSLHPSLPIFRVDKGVRFDSIYMEEIGGDKARKLVPTMIRIMVTPGFYVYDNVVKCKVICRYHNSNVCTNDSNGKGLTPSPM